MSAVKRWMKGKPDNIASYAVVLAVASENVSDALISFRKKTATFIPQPPLKKWLPLYRQHRKILPILEEAFTPLASAPEGNVNKMNEETLAQLQKAYAQPEMLFFFKVWGPCWLHYKTSPTKLFRKARRGRVNAMKKLLRLDNSVLFDPVLAERFHQIKARKSRAEYEDLLMAINNPVNQEIDPKKIKLIIAALISDFSVKHGKRLTAPVIRELFDAISQDRGRGRFDRDLPKSSEAFSQEIRRERKKVQPAKAG